MEEADVWDLKEIQGIENEAQIKNCDIFNNDKKIENNYFIYFQNRESIILNISSKSLL